MQWQSYVTSTVAVGTAVTLVLLGLVIVFQLALYIWCVWYSSIDMDSSHVIADIPALLHTNIMFCLPCRRCTRCLYFAFQRQPVQQASCPYAELTNRWLWALKCISVILGCGAIAFCVTGMVLLPRGVVDGASNTMTPAINYAADVLSSVDDMLASVQSLNPIINRVVAEVNDAVNITSMNLDLQASLSAAPSCFGYKPCCTKSHFAPHLLPADSCMQCSLQLLQSVPQPTASAATLQQLDTALQTGLDDAHNLSYGIQTLLALPAALGAISGTAAQLDVDGAQLEVYSAVLARLPSSE